MGTERDAEFEAFLAHEGPRLLTVAWLLCGDESTAARWSRQALERLYVRWGRRLRGEEQARARSILIALHTEHEKSRSESGRRRDQDGGLVEPGRPDEAPGEPDHALLLWALAQLTPRERQAVVLERYLDLPHPGAARVMRMRPAAVRLAGSRGWVRLRELVAVAGGRAPESEVVDLFNRASMSAPPMRLRTADVLGSARSLRRGYRRRRGGVVLMTVVVLAAVAWAVQREDRTEVVTAQDRVDWDSTDDFEVDVVTDIGIPWPELGEARLVRAAGETEFTLVRDGEEVSTAVSPQSADLPEGLSIFVTDQTSVVVSEALYDAPARLDLVRWAPQSSDAVELSDGSAAVRVWVVDGRLQGGQVLDVQWQLTDEVATSSGDSAGTREPSADVAPRDSPGRHEATFVDIAPDERYQGAVGDDGSAAAIAPLPADPRGYGDPPDAESVSAQLLLEVEGDLATSEEVALIPAAVQEVPRRPELVLAYLPQRSVQPDQVSVVPTVLFETDLGPRLAGRPWPARQELDGGVDLTVSTDPDLGVWAAGCGRTDIALGHVGEADLRTLECAQDEGVVEQYAVLVLPTEVAEQARALPPRDDEVVVGAPQVLPAGGGLALWSVRWSGTSGHGASGATRAPFEVDLDDEGRRGHGP